MPVFLNDYYELEKDKKVLNSLAGVPTFHAKTIEQGSEELAIAKNQNRWKELHAEAVQLLIKEAKEPQAKVTASRFGLWSKKTEKPAATNAPKPKEEAESPKNENPPKTPKLG